MPTKLRVIAAVAIVSGLTAAGAVVAESLLGVSELPRGLRRAG